MEYEWPGNVRELENVVERSLILNPKGPLTFEHMCLEPMKKAVNEVKDDEETFNLDENVSQLIHRVLKKTNGRVHGPGGAADLLGLNPSTLRNRMRKLGIDYSLMRN
jgi:DNA-binding NtrC family response regulator